MPSAGAGLRRPRLSGQAGDRCKKRWCRIRELPLQLIFLAAVVFEFEVCRADVVTGGSRAAADTCPCCTKVLSRGRESCGTTLPSGAWRVLRCKCIPVLLHLSSPSDV
jgi:hypothetical protein